MGLAFFMPVNAKGEVLIPILIMTMCSIRMRISGVLSARGWVGIAVISEPESN